jgi:hypothetical protein
MMIRGVALGAVLAVSLLAAPLAAEAQQPGKVYSRRRCSCARIK